MGDDTSAERHGIGTGAVAPTDVLAIGSLLSDTVRRYVAERIAPHVSDWFERGVFPAERVRPELDALGLLGMHLDGYGCAGSSATAYGLACLEPNADDSGLRSFMSVQGSLAMFPMAPRSKLNAFGGQISRFQLTQKKLVEMMIAIQRSTLLALGNLRMF